MDPEYKNEPFTCINIKRPVALKYRQYSRRLGRSQSMVLDQMISFFERHGLSPEDELPTHFLQSEKNVLRRINAVIAIIRDIEKKQTLPTASMLRALFEAEAEAESKSSRRVEKRFKGRSLEEELEQLKDSL